MCIKQYFGEQPIVYFENTSPKFSDLKEKNPLIVHLIQYMPKLGSIYKTLLMAFSHLLFNYLKTLKFKSKISCS